MESFLTSFSYAGIAAVLIISGFGVPLPEDLPLIFAGYLCAVGTAEVEIMLPLVFICLVGADSIVYWLGRKYGHHLPKLPLLTRFMTKERLAKAELSYHRHGGKTIFVARFLPGLRTAAYFTAGTFRIPFWKFLLFDGAAAVLSVPFLFFAGWYFSDMLPAVKDWARDAQIVAALVVITAIAIYIGVKRYRRQRRTSSATG